MKYDEHSTSGYIYVITNVPLYFKIIKGFAITGENREPIATNCLYFWFS